MKSIVKGATGEPYIDAAVMARHRQKEMDTHLPAGMANEFLEAVAREYDGGDCPQCGEAWREVSVANRFARFCYYEPACDCHPRCDGPWAPRTKKRGPVKLPGERCGESLHREVIVGNRHTCESCGSDWTPLARTPTATARYEE